MGGKEEVAMSRSIYFFFFFFFQKRWNFSTEGCCGTLNLIFSTTVSFERFWSNVQVVSSHCRSGRSLLSHPRSAPSRICVSQLTFVFEFLLLLFGERDGQLFQRGHLIVDVLIDDSSHPQTPPFILPQKFFSFWPVKGRKKVYRDRERRWNNLH